MANFEIYHQSARSDIKCRTFGRILFSSPHSWKMKHLKIDHKKTICIFVHIFFEEEKILWWKYGIWYMMMVTIFAPMVMIYQVVFRFWDIWCAENRRQRLRDHLQSLLQVHILNWASNKGDEISDLKTRHNKGNTHKRQF